MNFDEQVAGVIADVRNDSSETTWLVLCVYVCVQQHVCALIGAWPIQQC